MSDGFVKWFLEYLNKNTQYVDFFRKSSTPDESFFHTLLMNSTYAKTRVDYLHYIDWATNANSPKDLALDDFNNIVNSKKLFARKINDDALMTQIDKYITN